VFLDIQMPVLNGFEMLKKLDYVPQVIFTTAYDQYAIKAFQEQSLDYLLKPVQEERLGLTVQKLRNLRHWTGAPTDRIDVDELLVRMNARKPMTSITVTLGDRIVLIKPQDILYLHAEDKYVSIYAADGQRHLISKSLSGMEAKLPDQFVRVHRAFIINIDHVAEITKGFNGKLLFKMANKEQTRISTGYSYTQSVRELLQV